MVAAGGEVWFGDETTLREFPPLRSAWAQRGEQAVVVVSGRNSRRVVHGALNAATGELVTLIRERKRSRQDDCLAFVDTLGQVRPDVPRRAQTCPSSSCGTMRRRTTPNGFRPQRLPLRSPSLGCPSGRQN